MLLPVGECWVALRIRLCITCSINPDLGSFAHNHVLVPMVVLENIRLRLAVILQDKFLHHVAVHTDDCNMIGTLSVGLMIAEDPQRQEGSRHQKKNDEQIAPADHFQVFPHFPIPLFRKEKG